jgi:hypothetical protein
MLNQAQVSNPKDFLVVTFHNNTDFGFTPDMGCMYDSRPINGVSGTPGIGAGESITVPYHIGHRIATNLAKAVLTREAPAVDKAGIPTGVPLWDTAKLESLKNSFITELYSEAKPIAMSQTDQLMARVEALNKTVEGLVGKKEVVAEAPKTGLTYQDKAEVIAELTKRGIKFDARSNKATLEKLLVPVTA